MDLTIVMEYRFSRCRNGIVWTESTYDHSFWNRYLAVFDRVSVVARVRDVRDPSASWKRVDGDRVTVVPVPDYRGPFEYLRKWSGVRRAVNSGIRETSAVILRVPGNLGSIAAGTLRRRRQPYGVEVVGDPWDVFSRGASRHPLRLLFRVWFRFELKRQCANATAALYVTERALQRRYPPPNLGSLRVFGASDVELPEGEYRASNVEMPEHAFTAEPAPREAPATGPLKLICVAGMDQPYKGHHVLLKALAQCVGSGLDLELTLVGDGRLRPDLERLSARLGLSSRIKFRGQLPAGTAVRAELDNANLFVLPSLVEGMPRALIEAMGRGLPCIGSAVGGVVEVLGPQSLVRPGRVVDLAERIRTFAGDPELRRQVGQECWTTARRFRESELRPAREAFYRTLRDVSWVSLLDRRGAG